GRRLVASGELVPPQVYLDLGEAFLDAGDADAARRTFALTRDMPDHERFQRDAARLFEAAQETRLALDAYRALLATAPTDEGLLVKVGELQEALGADAEAADLYGRALELLLSRRPLSITRRADEDEADNPFLWWGARNTDDWDRWSARTLEGLLASCSAAELEERAAGHARLLAAELEQVLAERAARPVVEGEAPAPDRLQEHPRLVRRGEVVRRLAFASQRVERALEVDQRLATAFAEDDDSVEEVLRAWMAAGYRAAADGLLRDLALTDPVRLARLGSAVGRGGFVAGQGLGIEEALRSILPLVSAGDADGVRELLLRVEYGTGAAEDLPRLGTLFGAARWLGDQDAALRVGRQWLRLAMDEGRGSYEAEAALDAITEGLDGERARALNQYLVGRVLEDPATRADYATVIAGIQRRTGERFVEEEQALELLERSGRFYALPTILELLPLEARAAALRSTWPRVPANMRANTLLQCLQESQDELPQEFVAALVDLAPDAYREAPEYIQSFLGNLSDLSVNLGAGVALLDAWLELHPGQPLPRGARAVLLDRLGRTGEALAVVFELLPSLPSRPDGGNWEEMRVRTTLLERFAPRHADALTPVLEQLAPRAAFDLELELIAGRAGVRTWEDHPALREAWASVPERFPDDEVLLEESLGRSRTVRGFVAATRRLLELRSDPGEREALLRRLESRLRVAGFEAEALEARLERMGAEGGAASPAADGAMGALLAPTSVAAVVVGGASGASSGGAPSASSGGAPSASSGGAVIVAGVAAPAMPAMSVMPAIALTPASGAAVSLSVAGSSLELDELELSSDPGAVADAVRAGDVSGAARVLRRHWREFQVGIEPDSPYPIFGWGSSPLGRFRWMGEVPSLAASGSEGEPVEGPTEESSPGASEGAPPRTDAPEEGLAESVEAAPPSDDDAPATPVPAGGLSTWQDSVERVAQERPEALEILARYPELRSELERSLQVRETRALDAEQPVIEALAQADAAARGVERATQERIAALEGGTLGKRGQMELLALLDETPDAGGAEQVVRSLVGAVSPLDAEQARRLARVLARAGAQDEAIRLYRWCATTAGGGAARMSFSPFGDQGTTVTVAELVQEAKEVIDPDRRLGLVESILSLSVAPRYPWAREQAELEQLRVWEELVGPAEAFARARAVCEASIDLSTGLRRRVALRAAALFAHGGE
ncbi:MAG: hypothetical protein O2799_07805, partial [Planctomycetota bacterium]|nr:hypothetical protein [Planctomycetota bacterium]